MSTGYAQGEYSEDAFNTGAYGAGGEDFTMDAEGVDGEAIGKGFVDKPGTYHFEVEEATDEFVDPNGGANTNWRPNVNLRLRVLHTVPGQCPQGSIHFHRVRFPYPSDKAIMVGNDPNKQTSQYVLTQQELLEFLVSIGILKKTLDPKTGTSSIIDPDTGTGRIAHTTLAARLKGMQFIGKVKHRSYTPKTGKNAGITQQVYEFQYGRGCSLVDAPENADTPMNLDALKAIGRSRFVLPTAPPPSGRQAAQAAHPGQKPAAAAQGAQKPAAAAQQQKPTAAISGLDGI